MTTLLSPLSDSKLIDAARGVISDPHMFTVQATGIKIFKIEEKKSVEKKFCC